MERSLLLECRLSVLNAPCKGSRDGCEHSQEPDMDITTLLVIVLIVILLGGGGWYGRGRWY